MLADLALRYGVECFLYSSATRAGPKYEDLCERSQMAKSRIERHCRDLGDQGLPWTQVFPSNQWSGKLNWQYVMQRILRPGFFIENFDHFVGSIGHSVLKSGLKKDTSIGLIVCSFTRHTSTLLLIGLTNCSLGGGRYRKSRSKRIQGKADISPTASVWFLS